jgi:HEAT repeat protein
MSEPSLIVRDADILGGIPVFAGTRVPIRTLLDYLKAGQPLDDFLDDFPTVSREQALVLLRHFTSTLASTRGGERVEFLDAEDNPLELLWSSMDALGLAGDRQAIPLLIQALSHEDVDIRKEARWALVRIGEPVVLPLIDVLLDTSHPWRWFAVDALDRIGDARAKEPFIILLLDKSADPNARGSAATALGRLGGAGIFELLYERLIGDEWDVVRRGAAAGLGLLKDPRSLKPLLAASVAADPGLRWDAATALGHLVDSRSVESLIRLLNDSHWQVRRCAVEALGTIGDRRAVPALRQIAETHTTDPFLIMVQEAAGKALTQINREQED